MFKVTDKCIESTQRNRGILMHKFLQQHLRMSTPVATQRDQILSLR